MNSGRKIIIIAGPNGAGKTIFAREYLPNESHCPIFVNADLIAAGLSPLLPEIAAARAGRQMLREIDDHAKRGESFGFEITLASQGYLRRIKKWRADGYAVKLVFLSLATPEEAMARVKLRVSQGGHDIPEAVIRRRFHRGRENFERYRRCVNSWHLIDNNGDIPVLIEEGENP